MNAAALSSVANPYDMMGSPNVLAERLMKLKAQDRRFALEIATELKEGYRKKYFDAERSIKPQSYKEATARSHRFWSLYELVNRILDPDDPVYSIVNEGTALSLTADNLTCQAASAGQGRILEIIIGGESTTSTIARVRLSRAGTAITANTAITPEKFNTRSPAAAGTYGKAGTQALVGNPLLVLAFNTFGGINQWKAAPGEELYYVNSEVISMRSASGTPTVSSTIIFEEL